MPSILWKGILTGREDDFVIYGKIQLALIMVGAWDEEKSSYGIWVWIFNEAMAIHAECSRFDEDASGAAGGAARANLLRLLATLLKLLAKYGSMEWIADETCFPSVGGKESQVFKQEDQPAGIVNIQHEDHFPRKQQ